MEELLVLLVSPVLLVLFQYFDAAVVLGGVVDATTNKAVEIGAGRVAVCSGVPELVVAVDVLRPENHTACTVEDEEGVIGVALVIFLPYIVDIFYVEM